MARYRHKNDDDLRWNRIRRRITRELDVQIAEWREEALNKLLAGAWDKYTEALNSGEKLEIESVYEQFAHRALTGKAGIDLSQPEAPDVGE